MPHDQFEHQDQTTRRGGGGRMVVAGVVGACALGAGLGLWARPSSHERGIAAPIPPRQAEAQLIVKKLWMSGPGAYVYIQKIPIARLNRGQAVNLSGRFELPYFAKWDCADVVAGYCCQEIQIIVAVSYDPDIRMDGNLDNDDCNARNDRCYDAPAHHVWYQVECPW
jgi:hypothetical protein